MADVVELMEEEAPDFSSIKRRMRRHVRVLHPYANPDGERVGHFFDAVAFAVQKRYLCPAFTYKRAIRDKYMSVLLEAAQCRHCASAAGSPGTKTCLRAQAKRPPLCSRKTPEQCEAGRQGAKGTVNVQFALALAEVCLNMHDDIGTAQEMNELAGMIKYIIHKIDVQTAFLLWLLLSPKVTQINDLTEHFLEEKISDELLACAPAQAQALGNAMYARQAIQTAFGWDRTPDAKEAKRSIRETAVSQYVRGKESAAYRGIDALTNKDKADLKKLINKFLR